jgi:isocitrate dehydrogenase (NAD+)
MKHHITLLPGDGIGAQTVQAVQEILAAAAVPIEWEVFEAGERTTGSKDEILANIERSIRKNRVALQGKIVSSWNKEFPTITIALRKRLELFANIRPISAIPGIGARFDKIDIVMIRENLEDVYAGVEHEVVPGVVQSIRLTTRAGSERIVRFAFEYVKKRGRRKLSVIHKANIMKMADGLFLDCARRIKADYPDVEFDELIVDNAAMQLVSNPYRFDVMLLPNLYGDILSDLAGGLAGGLGTVPSMSTNRELAVFESIHGYAPHLRGTPWVNPMTLLTPTIYMLHHIGEVSAANRIERALRKVIAEGKVRTPDMGGQSTTADMVQAVIAAFP